MKAIVFRLDLETTETEIFKKMASEDKRDFDAMVSKMNRFAQRNKFDIIYFWKEDTDVSG